MTTSNELSQPSSAVPQTHGLIKNHGDSWELFGLFLMNAALTVFTLGIYRFWGKTRIRRYLWGNLELLGDRLEYTGTGKELFLGFLFVFFVILLPLFGGVAVLDGMLIGVNEDARAVLGFVQFVIILFLIGVAFFRARRYRLTRTHWRGIYGAQTGSPLKYGFMNLAAQVINGLTLGLALPATSVWLKRYEMNHTWVGNEQPEFNPSIKALYKPFVVPWIFVAMAGGVAVALFSKLDELPMGADQDPSPEQLAVVAGLLGTVYLMAIPVFLATAWYRGRVYNHFVSVTRFHDHGFASNITGLSFMWLVLSNMLLVVLTLGFGMPFTYQRYLAYVEKRVGIVGDGNFDNLLQSEQEKPGTGEGLADAFDIGAI